MDEGISLTISVGDLIMLILGLVGTFAIAALMGMRKHISELHDAHLGPDARDQHNHLRWYTPEGLVQAINENSSETQQLGDRMTELASAIKEEARAVRGNNK